MSVQTLCPAPPRVVTVVINFCDVYYRRHFVKRKGVTMTQLKKAVKAILGISFIVYARDEDNNPITNADGVWDSSFSNAGSTKDLQENDSVLFDNPRVYYMHASSIDEALQARGLHLASPDAGKEYRTTRKGKIRMWVAPFDVDGEYATAGITIE